MYGWSQGVGSRRGTMTCKQVNMGVSIPFSETGGLKAPGVPGWGMLPILPTLPTLPGIENVYFKNTR